MQDVYKRQVYLVLGVEVVDAAKVGPQPQRSLVVLYDAPDGRAVSYTQLDVYKRQVQGLLQDTGLISHLYFRSVHNEAGEDDFVGFRRCLLYTSRCV